MTYKLIGLNKPWKAAGFNSIYATLEQGTEDWFHCAFDKEKFTDEKLTELFNTFKDSEENLWHKKNHRVYVAYHNGKPAIIELDLDLNH